MNISSLRFSDKNTKMYESCLIAINEVVTCESDINPAKKIKTSKIQYFKLAKYKNSKIQELILY